MGFFKKKVGELKSEFKKSSERRKKVKAIEVEAFQAEQEKQAKITGTQRARMAGKTTRKATFDKFKQFASSVPSGAPRSGGLSAGIFGPEPKRKKGKNGRDPLNDMI